LGASWVPFMICPVVWFRAVYSYMGMVSSSS
jgi:hypothetical protein